MHSPRVKHSGIKPKTYCKSYRPNASPLQIYTTILRIQSNCQLSTINCQLSTVNCQLSTINCQLSTF
ncbi:MAG: hypothetical protein HC942_22325 [Microcoleus sp. SU_5_6]|nr:hypothetical protein [Microcoleus sp. SU_5_6]